ncbi:hypothetical protein CAPTEDRAFT_189680 [Capitella teleta]|uniref:Uncharacterized protein n=1 Tax=Capitella teleta TaxID=283909 RepID=R7U158_CAPTE|nr:hypothetical protein CAPTEDRAFT_189680 [Capitella teleta]|eukprot:ELT99943.1 hypothetical protein CAPTEDRAFT_189680 [Capitella teleta]
MQHNKAFDVGLGLTSKIRQTTSSFIDNLPGNYSNSFYLNPISEEEVSRAIIKLKIDSPGRDQISPIVVKSNNDIFTPYLTHLFNISLQCGIVPKAMKCANITPVYKAGSMTKFRQGSSTERYLHPEYVLVTRGRADIEKLDFLLERHPFATEMSLHSILTGLAAEFSANVDKSTVTMATKTTNKQTPTTGIPELMFNDRVTVPESMDGRAEVFNYLATRKATWIFQCNDERRKAVKPILADAIWNRINEY